MSESRLNIELFKKIRDKIASTPEAYDQESYGRREESAPCGTAACIAGWACVLGGRLDLEVVRDLPESLDAERYHQVHNSAAQLLGLSRAEASVLFTDAPGGIWEDYDDEGNDVYEGAWAEPFGELWRDAPTEGEAAVAIAYLDHIIETGKVLE